MLTLKQASAHVDGLSAFRIKKMCESGELKHIKAGNKYLICLSALHEVIGHTNGLNTE